MGRGKCACKAGFQLATVVTDAQSGGATPAQTMSRVLQELRDEGVVIFDGRGRYRLAEPSAAEPDSQSASIDADCRPAIAARELARVSRAVSGDCGGVCGGGAGALMRARVGLRLPPLQPSARRGEGVSVWGIIPQPPDAHFFDAGFSLDPLAGAGRVLPLAGEGWRACYAPASALARVGV